MMCVSDSCSASGAARLRQSSTSDFATAPHQCVLHGGLSSAPTGGATPPTPLRAGQEQVEGEAEALALITGLISQLPRQLSKEEASILHDPFAVVLPGRINPLGVVLLQEMSR